MAATGALSGAVRSYPTSEVRGRSREDPMPEGGAARRSYPTSKVRGSGRECQAVRAQEQPRGTTPRLRSGAARRGVIPCRKSGAAAGRSYPTPEARVVS